MSGKRNNNVKVKRSSAGLGLFAEREFKKDDEIIEYTGELINGAERDRRGGRYLFEINEDLIIDGSSRQNTARYINHSCRPNADSVLYEDTNQIMVVARKKISPSEEITVNYGKEYFNEYIKPNGCRCTGCLET